VDEKLTAQQIVARVSARTPPQRGTTVRLAPSDPSNMHVFSEKTLARLSA
jgi:multiple sugar transport system ATP-binding protein